jgi:Mrp family chromosome partitioning ATPase
MTVINRALHKAYQRRAESKPDSVLQGPGATSISGWAASLREPIRPPVRSQIEQAVTEPAVALATLAETPSLATTIPETGLIIRLDEGHLNAADLAPALTTTPAAEAASPAAQPGDQWSWPPIVQRLLTCTAAKELRDLAVHLRDLAASHDLRCMAFSGPGRNAGRTSLVLTIASVIIADKSTRVAIVDADFDHPDAARLISLNPAAGLEDAIQQPGDDDRAVTTLIAGRLGIVPLVNPVEGTALDPRRIGNLQAFLRTLRREYDLVLIDAGPWEAGRVPLVIRSRAVDALACVCRAGSAAEGSANERDFRQPGVEWLGVIETFVPVQQPGPQPAQHLDRRLNRPGRDDDV